MTDSEHLNLEHPRLCLNVCFQLPIMCMAMAILYNYATPTDCREMHRLLCPVVCCFNNCRWRPGHQRNTRIMRSPSNSHPAIWRRSCHRPKTRLSISHLVKCRSASIQCGCTSAMRLEGFDDGGPSLSFSLATWK